VQNKIDPLVNKIDRYVKDVGKYVKANGRCGDKITLTEGKGGIE
jgi:hypothetical protein